MRHCKTDSYKHGSKGRGMMGLVVWQQLEGRQFDTPVSWLVSQSCGPPAVEKLPIMPMLLGVMLVAIKVLQCLMGHVVLL
ncbi:unnamed protein product [Staurois parvus]|uniref:Uncharacterized protein n=1 Tax=Staurois parvus TaxID=386267 RepID=A0ABN9G6Q0_9NEOB|nr:unnamed protein product [Staurois parvus]